MTKTAIAKATFFTTTISLPVKAIMLSNTLKGLNVGELEKYFENMLQTLNPNDNFHNIKSDYEKCHTLMKWAHTCNASLEYYINCFDIECNRAIDFSFGFVDMDNMELFVQTLDTLHT